MYSDNHKSVTVFLRDTKTVAGAFIDTKMVADIYIMRDTKTVAGVFKDTKMVAYILIDMKPVADITTNI